jgi:NAD(P)-dependent dehydrogenase (short-subunit alcohol dehydrogenase family)
VILARAVARAIGCAGARVALVDLREESAAAHAAELAKAGIEAVGVGADCLDAGAVEAALSAAKARIGDITILVNMAGGNTKDATIAPGSTIFDATPEALRRVVDLNLFAGAIVPSMVVGRHMAAHGAPSSIINISSMAASRPLTRVVGYAAAKAAVDNFTKWLAVHFAMEVGVPVRVNAIAPGFFLTEQNRFLLTNEDGSLTARGDTIRQHTPMGRFGNPDDLAGTAVWLASEASAFVTGIVVPVDGGFSAFSGV